MRAVIQRVLCSSVVVDERVVGSIGAGMLILLGVEASDTQAEAMKLCNKIAKLRIFADGAQAMNLSLNDLPEMEILVVSQFTLMADVSRGNRPSFLNSAPRELAVELYEFFKAQLLQVTGCTVQSGVFGAHMQVNMQGDGPVTIVIDSFKDLK